MSYKNYAAVNKINKLEMELEEYKGKKVVKEEAPKEEVKQESIMTLDSILSIPEEEPVKTQTIEKEISDYPRFATITGAQSLEINFYDLGRLVREYEEVFPNEDKKLA